MFAFKYIPHLSLRVDDAQLAGTGHGSHAARDDDVGEGRPRHLDYVTHDCRQDDLREKEGSV